MAHNLETKTNEELIKLISDAAAELEWRRKANEAARSNTAQKDSDTDSGGDHPTDPPKFP